MIVVSNTSPLTNLAAVGHIELLQHLYRTVHIADGVWAELTKHDDEWPGRREVAAADWIQQHSVDNQALVTALRQDLDRGEAETIALAMELKADLVLIDEKAGRQLARHMGLAVGGVLGVLLQAKDHGHIASVRPILDDLRHTANFYVSQSLYQHVLDVAGESPDGSS